MKPPNDPGIGIGGSGIGIGIGIGGSGIGIGIGGGIDENETARLPPLLLEQLDDDQRELYDTIARGPRAQGQQLFAITDGAGGLTGPFNAMLLAPRLGAALQSLGNSIRFGGALTDRAREIAILVVAQHWDSAFERYAHEAVGRAAGLTEAELDALRTASLDAFADPYEQLLAHTTFVLVTHSDLTSLEYAAARDGLGLPVLFELMTLIGYYATLALQLRVFRVTAP